MLREGAPLRAVNATGYRLRRPRNLTCFVEVNESRTASSAAHGASGNSGPQGPRRRPRRRRRIPPEPARADAASGAMFAPAAAKSASEMDAVAPAPVSTATVRPRPTSFLIVSGVAATRVSAVRRSFSTARRMLSILHAWERARSRERTYFPQTKFISSMHGGRGLRKRGADEAQIVTRVRNIFGS